MRFIVSNQRSYLDHKMCYRKTSSTHPCIMAPRINSSREETMTSVPVAGILNTLHKINFKLSVKKGAIRSNTSGEANSVFKSNIGDVSGVSKERALTGMKKSLPSSQLLSDDTHEKLLKDLLRARAGY